MKRILTTLLSVCCLILISYNVIASPPSVLITLNKTSVKSNAYIDGNIPSLYPTLAHSNRSVSWIAVNLACQGHIMDSICKAIVMMDVDSGNPVELGEVTLNMKTGEILPLSIINNGYHLAVVGQGRIELSEVE